MKQALLLVAHGSRQPEANDDLHHVAAALRQRGYFDIVEESFLELAEPSISQGGARCVEKDAGLVVMVPYFLSAGVHVRRDLTARRDDLARQFPHVEFLLAEPLGRDPRLLDVVVSRAQEVVRPLPACPAGEKGRQLTGHAGTHDDPCRLARQVKKVIG
jgi:sirohydrochlorin ferrochelatase